MGNFDKRPYTSTFHVIQSLRAALTLNVATFLGRCTSDYVECYTVGLKGVSSYIINYEADFPLKHNLSSKWFLAQWESPFVFPVSLHISTQLNPGKRKVEFPESWFCLPGRWEMQCPGKQDQRSGNSTFLTFMTERAIHLFRVVIAKILNK